VDTYVNPTSLGLKAEISINLNHINSMGGSVYPRFRAQLQLKLTEESGRNAESIQAISLGSMTSEWFLANEKIGDGIPFLVNHEALTYRPYSDTIHLDVDIPPDTKRIEAIERFRAGKSLTSCLRFKISAMAFGQSGNNPTSNAYELRSTSSINGQITFTIPDTQWREKVLPELGYGKVIAIELPAVPIESVKSLEHSYKALEQAQKQFQLGHYDDAVGKCRVALDRFFEQVDKGDGSGKKIPKLKRSWETRLGESTYRWLDESLSAIKDAANKPHHSPNNHFDRLAAQMLMMVSTALISYAASYEGNGNE